jgi:curved DNA-binding protein CbpA
MSSIDRENVGPDASRTDTFTLDLELSKPHEENIFATDYYEILRVAPHADEDTIDRVYRTLADRFHPDNPSTGDPETFLRVRKAYDTLSDRAERAKYNASRQDSRGSTRFLLRGREFFDGVRGGQNRRLALLCLLYRKRISTHEFPGMTILDLEQSTGCMREEVTSALWYLVEKQWAINGEFSAYSITADGFDFVESKLEDRLEFRALATMCYYRFPAELESQARTNTLPLDIEPAITSDGNVYVADHYEIMGIGPQADEEAIERIYRTLASRFHPDNPSTGDARTYLRLRDAYDTLSNQARRAQYNALRQRTNHSGRFRLRGREFFDGIKGEQLRRLAVLCILYRQAASELPGLTVLDLEQLTGCTREELGSALWYLREKKWAKYGEFTEYSITVGGFDVVENKLDDREAARSRVWLDPEDTRGNGLLYSQADVTQVDEQNQQPRLLIANAAAAPENLISYRTVEIEPPQENVEVARGAAQVEEDSATQSRQDNPVTPHPLIPNAATAPDIRNLQTAGISSTDIFQHLLRLQKAGELPEEQVAVRADQQVMQNQENSADSPAEMVQNLLQLQKATESSGEEPAASAVENRTSHRIEEGGTEDVSRSRPLRSFVRKLLGFDDGTKASAPSQRIYQITPQYPISGAIASEHPNSHEQPAVLPVPAKQVHFEDRVEAPDPQPTATPEPAQIEEACGPAEKSPATENIAEVQAGPVKETAQSQPNVTPQSPGVTNMSNSTNAIAEHTGGVAVGAAKRVIFSMGGKGGVGKTSVMTGLAEWFDENRIPVTLLDLDTENKACGSLTHFFSGRVPKINIHTPAGLDAFIDHLSGDAPVILADMGAGAGQVTHEWFDTMYPDMAEASVVFTAVGVVTPDPASVESVLNWATALQDRVDYVIIENNLTEHADFTYWRDGGQAQEFQRRYQPAVLRMDNRLAELENAARNYGATLGRVAGRATGKAELQKASLVMRAQSYRRRMFTEFDRVKGLLLP